MAGIIKSNGTVKLMRAKTSKLKTDRKLCNFSYSNKIILIKYALNPSWYEMHSNNAKIIKFRVI